MNDGRTDLAGDEPTEVLVQPEADEWPVSELYRVPPDEQATAEDGAVVVSSAQPSARRRIPASGAGLAAAIALVTLGIGVGAWLLTQEPVEESAQAVATTATETTPETEIPTTTSSPPSASGRSVVEDVVGMRLANARAVLAEAGFRLRILRRSSDAEPGQVLEQAPAAGRRLARGESVTLTVARPAEPVVVRVTVPEVVSLSVSDASAAIRRVELRVQVELVPSKEEPGTVVESDPAAGSELREGSLVVLSVARRSREVAQRIAVPDVVGATVADARRTLRDLGLRVSVARVLSSAPAGTVVEQSPRSGTRVRDGASVRLRVSTGPRSIALPDVVGLDEITARAELEAAGFVVRVSEEPTSDPALDGVVIRQSPTGGTAGEDGQVVTIVVGRLD